MRRKVAFILLLLTISFVHMSCSDAPWEKWENLYEQYPDQYDTVTLKSLDEDSYYYEYNGQRYNRDTLLLFEVWYEAAQELPESDVLIGWYLERYMISYLNLYYSYTSEDPVCIYLSRIPEMFLREDYNYQSDTFVIEGTEHQFVFSDMLTLSDAFEYRVISSYPNEKRFALYSKLYPRLRITLSLFQIDGVWYAGGRCDEALFEVSEELLEFINFQSD